MVQIRLSVDKAPAIRKLRAVPEALARAVARWQDMGGQYVRTTMVQVIRSSQRPGGKGFLSNSVQVRRAHLGFSVVATASYADAVDKGTRPHVIRPRERDGVLAFTGRDGTTVFAKYVRHPGTKAMDYTGRTANAVAGRLAGILDEEADRELKGLGEA